jgi:hypothetical protein
MPKPLYLSATKLAIRIGSSAQNVNTMLGELGYQELSEDRKWVPTEKGRTFCQMTKGKDLKGKEYVMLTWHPDLVMELVAISSPSRAEFVELKAAFALLEARVASLGA